MLRAGADVVSHVVGLGDTPRLEKMIGAVKVQIDAYLAGEIDVLYIAYTRFINTMKQEPVIEQLLPLSDGFAGKAEKPVGNSENAHQWDYLYEPNAKSVIDELLLRYVEAVLYQAVAENIASEQNNLFI